MSNVGREKNCQNGGERGKSCKYGGERRENSERNRRARSLRSMKADLKVIVGQEKGKQEMYWHFSQTLASQSGYVDTFLSTNLPTKNKSNPSGDHQEITFPNITPSLWERMMEFLKNPLEMTVGDAMELASLYDQYEFETGIEICDQILSKKALVRITDFDDLSKIVYSPEKLDLSVQAIALSERSNLRRTFHWGRVWLFSIFNHLKDGGAKAGFPLTARQIKQLVPTIIRDDELPNFSTVLDPSGGFDELDKHLKRHGKDLGFNLVKQINLPHFDCPITNPVFPELFIALYERSYALEVVQKCVRTITVDINGTSAFTYHRQNDGSYKYEEFSSYWLRKCPESRRWELGRGGKVYTCINSEFAPVPPKKGWVGKHDSNLPVPTLTYS